MGRKEIEKEYCKLTKEIESMCIYDGRNTVDRYVCEKCGGLLHTTYQDKGVTPFVITCPMCGGMMSHTQTFRKEIVPESVEIKNWFRPTLEQTLKMSDGTIEHILNGGLILEE